MNDTLEERILAEQLHRVVAGAPVPATPIADDLRRGRGRVRRRRGVATIGSSAAVVALAAGGFAFTGGSTDADRTSGPPVADVPQAPAVDPGGSRADQLDVIAELGAVLQGDGERPFTLATLNAAIEVVMGQLDGDPVNWVAAALATSWQTAGADGCPSGWSCEDLTIDGVSRARWGESGTVHQVVLENSGEVLVVTINSVDERPTDLAFTTD